MGYVSNWLNDHNFHRKDFVGFWETLLVIVLVAMVIITVIAVVSPDTAAIILAYFL